MDPFPEVAHFASAVGSWMLLEQIVAVSLRYPDGISIPSASINLRPFGGDAGGSRSNLRRVSESGYDLGVLEAPPQGGAHILLSSRMLWAFLTFIASYLGNYQLPTPPE